MGAPTRRTQPVGGAASDRSRGGGIDSIVPHPSDSGMHPSLFGAPPAELPCWRCRKPTVERDHRGVLPECKDHHFHDDARPDDQDTSRAAARSTNRSPRGRLARLVLDDLRRHGPSTDDEVAARHPDEHPGSLAKRRGVWVERGIVRDTGQTRPTRRGVPAIVWAVVSGE